MKDELGNADDTAQHVPFWRRWESWVLLAIILLAFGLRSYRLESQSVWSDEFDNIAAIGEADFQTYLAQTLHRNPVYPPLYYLLQYAWVQLFGTSVLGLRLFCIALSLITIPVIYSLGRHSYGSRAGLIAALCFALSPTHLFYSQEMAPFAVLTLCEAFSIYALLRAVQTSRIRWWVFNLFLNAAVIWLHPSGPVLLLPQGCFVLYVFGKQLHKTAIYTVAQSIPFLLCALWLNRGLAQSPVFFEAPGLIEMTQALFGSDALSFSHNILPSPTTLSLQLDPLWLVVDYGMLFLFTVVTFWAVYGVIGALIKRFKAPQSAADPAVLIAAVALLPVPTIALMGYFWKTNWEAHYWLYASLFLYLILGAALMRIPRLLWRRVALVLLLVLYVAALARLLPATSRTNWKGVSQHITAQAAPQDIVLVGSVITPIPLPLPLLRFHMAETALPLFPLTTFQGLCEKSAAYLDRSLAQSGEGETGVWALIWLSFFPHWETPKVFQDCLASYGLQATERAFPGQAGLYLYRIQKAQDSADGIEPIRMPVNDNYPMLCEQIASQIPDPVKREEALESLQQVYGLLNPPIKHALDYACYSLQAYEENLDLAIALARCAVADDPSLRIAYMILAMALWQADRHAEAEQALEPFFALAEKDGRPYTLDVYEPLMQAIASGKLESIRAEAQALLEINAVILPPAFLAHLGLAPVAPF